MRPNCQRKREYVQITSKIIEEEGLSGITIRKVASRAGCTSAVLYKHFENREHLIMLASVQFLEPYILRFLELSYRKDLTPIQIDLLLWKCFTREAFRNAPYYELMFFSDQKEMLEDCIYEYYQMFPDMQKQFDGFTASIIFSSDLEKRELLRLRRAANVNLISLENASLLSQLSSAVFYGVFTKYSRQPLSEGELLRASDNCFQLIFALFQQFVKPGTDLHIPEE